MKQCSIREELETIVTLVSSDAGKRKVELVLEPSETDAIVMADGEKLRQSFLNIIVNALQATPAGGNVTMTLSENTEGNCKIMFRDNGEGIKPEMLARIFEPFYTTKPDGTGLGLAITKKIIEGHGGTVEVESTAGQGTTVTVKLPALQIGEQE